MKQNKIRFILDFSLSPVLPKIFEGVKNDFPFVWIWSETQKQLHVKKNVFSVLLTCADLVQSKKKNSDKNVGCALQGRNFTKLLVHYNPFFQIILFKTAIFWSIA